MIQKSRFFCDSIATNDELVLLTIEGKWLEAILHMTKYELLDLLHPKQAQLRISIRIYGKFQLLPTFALVGFQEDIQQFISQAKTNLKCEGLIDPLTIIHCDNIQHSVNHKLNFDELKSISKQKPF